MIDVSKALVTVTTMAQSARARQVSAQKNLTDAQQEHALLEQTDLVLRAILKHQTDSAFQEVEQLLLKGLQAVFGPEWTGVHLNVTQKHGRLWADISFKYGDVEGPPLEAFGGGPASVAAFLLRFLVVRRCGLAPLLLLDESFSQVSASAIPALGKFLRLLVDKLGFTILLVTHQPLFLESATKAYRATHDGNQTTFTPVKGE